MSRFADLGVSRPVANALSERGITAPFAVQELVIADVLAGHDVLVQSPTGSGKTLAFGVPLVDLIEADARRPAALVLVPTRELATQIVDELRILVIDEADRMLDMGFKPAVDRIVAKTPRDRQTIFCSATLESAAGKVARSYTSDARRHVHRPVESATGTVAHRFVHLEHTDKVGALVDELRGEAGRTLVFVRTKRGADRLVKRLGQQGVKAVAMHGNKSQGQRERALASFERGDVATLVATDVAARGIDVERIARVINFDLPGDHDAYVHRVGRTGRAGRDGTGISFVLPDQHDEMRAIAKHVGLTAEFDQAPRSHGAPAAPAAPPRQRRRRRR